MVNVVLVEPVSFMSCLKLLTALPCRLLRGEEHSCYDFQIYFAYFVVYLQIKSLSLVNCLYLFDL